MIKKFLFFPALVFVLALLVIGQMLPSNTKASPADDTTIALPLMFGSGVPVLVPDVVVDFSTSLGAVPEMYGTNGWWTDQDAAIWQQRYAELNPRMVRMPLGHVSIEPINDNSDPLNSDLNQFQFSVPIPITGTRTMTYDQWFAALQAADFTVMVYIPYLAPWLSEAENPNPLAAPYPPNDLAEYQELVRVLLNHLISDIGFAPEKIILEPVNEPDLNCGADPAVACFWDNWQMEDLAAVLAGAAQAAEDVDPLIRIAGPALCCQMHYLDQLFNQYQASTYLDIITFHHYNNGGDPNFDMMLNIAAQLQNHNKPVYLDEYGNKAYWSNGVDGALWHSAALGEFWQANLPPIQFSMAEMPLMHEGYNELGLFYNWQQNWETKPAYWVYVNFYNNLADRELVSISSPVEMPGMAAKATDQSLAIWITNHAYEKDGGGEIVLRMENWPHTSAQVQAFDNLSSADPVAVFDAAADGSGELTFTYPIPPRQSMLFLVSTPTSP